MPFITLVLIAITVFISLKGFNDNAFFNRYKFSVTGIRNKENIRYISSGFLHADYIHLGFNMYALYLFSGTVLHHFSTLEFLLIYFGSMLAGNLLSYKVNENNFYYNAVGASGAVSGIVYASILLYPNMTLYLFPIPFPIKGYIFGIGYLAYSIYGMKKQLGSIGHSAHLGGAITGYVITLLYNPKILSFYPFEAGLMAIPIIYLVVMLKKKP